MLNSVDLGKPNIADTPSPLFDHQETDQFKIVQTGYLAHQRRRSAGGEQAVDVAFLLDVDDGVDRFTILAEMR